MPRLQKMHQCVLVGLILTGLLEATLPLSLNGGSIAEEDRDYWAFQPLELPIFPSVKRTEWPQNPIDTFVLAKLEAVGIEPAPEADADILRRRLAFDLLGLPSLDSSPMVQDSASREFSASINGVIDQYMASPRYGEHWARQWLDLVRYADSNGFKTDEYRPHTWRYRDYVINAFNADKSYADFVTEQIAGDELPHQDQETLIATGYLRLWPYESNQRNLDIAWGEILDSITDNVGEVFLGLGIGCARCHDHKFDPVLQEDYFRIRAFFAALNPDDSLTGGSAATRQQHNAQMAQWREATASLRERIQAIETPAHEAAVHPSLIKFDRKYQTLLSAEPGKLTPYEQQLRALGLRQLKATPKQMAAKMNPDTKSTWEQLRKELAAFDKLRPGDLPKVMAVKDIGHTAPATTIPNRSETIEPGFLSVLGEKHLATIESSDASTGRRTALAQWLVQSENPLTARVLVNRIWQRHFGKGIVATANDFGKQGRPPTHRLLLDWLAGELIRSHWSIKHVQRLIVSSATYQQAALHSGNASASAYDPGNQLLWRMPIRRLSAEQIRDAMLQLSGELDLKVGGEGRQEPSRQRSIYLRAMRNTPVELLCTFDAPEGFNSTSSRNVTTTPTQALLLLNGDWAYQRAAAFADRLHEKEQANVNGISWAYHQTYGRQPTDSEIFAANAFIDQQAAVHRSASQSPETDPRREAMVDFVHVLLNSSEFLYLQ